MSQYIRREHKVQINCGKEKNEINCSKTLLSVSTMTESDKKLELAKIMVAQAPPKAPQSSGIIGSAIYIKKQKEKGRNYPPFAIFYFQSISSFRNLRLL